MSAELNGTATGHGADPPRRGPNVLVCKCGTPCIKKYIGDAIFLCLTAATVICIKLKSPGKFHFYLPAALPDVPKRNINRSTDLSSHIQKHDSD